jgi:2-keto-4-pentenoate hydratase
MDDADRTSIVELADRLWRAEVERTPIPPVTEGRPDLTVQDAYAIQSHNVDRRIAAGGVVRGRKVGLTSRPM